MARVGRHLSPAMACQQAVDHRGLDRLAKTLRQSGSNRGNDHQMAGGRAFQPRFQERDFFLLGEEGFPASAPVAGGVGPPRLVLAEGGREARHGRTANAQNGGGLFEGGPEQGRQQHRLTWSQRFDGGGDGGGHLRPLNDEWINPAWSCHAPTLPLLASSWKRIRIRSSGLYGFAPFLVKSLRLCRSLRTERKGRPRSRWSRAAFSPLSLRSPLAHEVLLNYALSGLEEGQGGAMRHRRRE